MPRVVASGDDRTVEREHAVVRIDLHDDANADRREHLLDLHGERHPQAVARNDGDELEPCRRRARARRRDREPSRPASSSRVRRRGIVAVRRELRVAERGRRDDVVRRRPRPVADLVDQHAIIDGLGDRAPHLGEAQRGPRVLHDQQLVRVPGREHAPKARQSRPSVRRPAPRSRPACRPRACAAR